MQHKRTLPSIQEGLNKKQIAELANQSVESVLEEGNVFQIVEALAAMEEFVKTVRKDERFIQFVRGELVKYHGWFQTASGAKIELCETAISYSYNSYAEWQILDEQIKFLTAQKKAVEEKLRKAGPGKVAIDTQTGEVMEGALKTSKSTYRITLAK